MTKDAIQQQMVTKPFKPFSLRLTDGSLIPVPHQEFIAVSPGGRTVVVFTEGEKFSMLDVGLITAIESAAANGK
jgi:hypothetical protein